MSADDYTSSVSSPASSYGLSMFGDAGGLDSWSSSASSMSFSSGNGQHPGSRLSREDYEQRLQQLQTQNSLLQVEAQTTKFFRFLLFYLSANASDMSAGLPTASSSKPYLR
jgi:hypothetical protein